MSQQFLDLNDRIAYIKVDSRSDAVSIRSDAKDYSQEVNKCIAIIFENRYHLHLAPGHDPYQIRQEIDDFISGKSDTESKTTTRTATQSSSNPTKKSTTKTKSSKKK